LFLDIRKDKWLYLMLLPGIIYFLTFKYGPIFFLITAFQDYQPFVGFSGSEWVGVKHFARFFGDPAFGQLFGNTLTLSLLSIVFNFPLPIIFALMLNEVKHTGFKRVVQTVSYMPHFLSWTIIAGITYVLFTTEQGLINQIIESMGGEPIPFLASEKLFRPMYTGQSVWQGTGWGTIIYLAALSGIDAELFEAARIDGASRTQQLWYITLPCIRTTIITLFILRLGSVMDTGFEHVLNMMNALNRGVAEVFDTYVYDFGLNNGQLSYATAVGLFKSVIGLVLVIATDRLAKRLGEEGIL
jgi:putative aldouronate transport system permease protein